MKSQFLILLAGCLIASAGAATRGAGKILHQGPLGADRADNPSFQEFFKKLPIRGPGMNKNYNGYRKPTDRYLTGVAFDLVNTTKG